MAQTLLNREGHFTALDSISDELVSAQHSLMAGQNDRYKTKLQSALVSIQVLLQQGVGN